MKKIVLIFLLSIIAIDCNAIETTKLCEYINKETDENKLSTYLWNLKISSKEAKEHYDKILSNQKKCKDYFKGLYEMTIKAEKLPPSCRDICIMSDEAKPTLKEAKDCHEELSKDVKKYWYCASNAEKHYITELAKSKRPKECKNVCDKEKNNIVTVKDASICEKDIDKNDPCQWTAKSVLRETKERYAIENRPKECKNACNEKTRNLVKLEEILVCTKNMKKQDPCRWTAETIKSRLICKKYESILLPELKKKKRSKKFKMTWDLYKNKCDLSQEFEELFMQELMNGNS